jgi:hypothetical protein
MHELPFVEGICSKLLHMQTPELFAAVYTHTRATGHAQLLVPAIPPELNFTVRQLKQMLPIITLVVALQMHCPPLITKGERQPQVRLALFQTKLARQPHAPNNVVLDEYRTVLQSKHVVVAEAIAKAGLQMQEVPVVDGICKALLQEHAPVLVAAVKTNTRGEGQAQLTVFTIGPVLNRTAEQFKQKVPIRTLVDVLQLRRLTQLPTPVLLAVQTKLTLQAQAVLFDGMPVLLTMDEQRMQAVP